jgi:ribosomal protein S18 acetylase RimI-like enzyme
MKTIRPAELEDLGRIADLHLEVFPLAFLTDLGRPFVLRMYRLFLQPPRCCFFVCIVDGKVIGFAVGLPADDSRNWRLAARELPWFAVASLGAFVRSPFSVAKKLLARFFSVDGEPDYSRQSFLLRSIGVSERFRGSGVARDLLLALESAAADMGAISVVLTTDAEDNEGAISFYSKMGYWRLGEFLQDGRRRMLVLEKSLR